jgi:hypothetical protein
MVSRYRGHKPPPTPTPTPHNTGLAFSPPAPSTPSPSNPLPSFFLPSLARARISSPAERRSLLHDDRLVALLARVEALTFDLPPQALANTLHALGKLGYTPPQLFLDQLTDACEGCLDRFKPQVPPRTQIPQGSNAVPS